MTAMRSSLLAHARRFASSADARRVPSSASPGRRDAGLAARGQSAVEFVLVLPIMMLLALAIGDFGRVYATGVAVEDAAREAADFAAFDDIAASHFEDPVPGTVDAKDSTRLEALRRACAAVSSLPGYQPTVAATCADPTARCTAAASSFCQLVVEDSRANPPFASTCGIAPQTDFTCGWVVHVTLTWEFRTVLNVPPLPSSITLVRESHFAISALPGGTPPGP